MKHESKFSRYYWFVAVALLFCVSNLAYAFKLDADEVRQLVSGKTLVIEQADGGKIRNRYYAADGTFWQKNKKGKKRKGAWYINSKAQLCHKRKSSETCHSIYKQGDVWATYIPRTNPTKGDKHANTIKKVLDGNPYGL